MAANRTRMMSVAAMAVALIAAAPPMAMPDHPPGVRDSGRILAGNYRLDPAHSQIAFVVDHMGFSLYNGLFGDPTGTMTLDPARVENSRIEITIPINRLVSTSAALNTHLLSADFFDVARFPTAKFLSTRIQRTGADRARLEGQLTLHGVTRPVVLDVLFYGAGTHPMTQKAAIGFRARGTIKRSDFDMGNGRPMVGDQVGLTIEAAFEPA